MDTLQWASAEHGDSAVRARPSAPTTHYLLLLFSLLFPYFGFSLLFFSYFSYNNDWATPCCAYFVFFVVHPLLIVRAEELPCGRARARQPRTTFYPLLSSPYFGRPLQSDHALLSTFFSLLSTFETIPPKRHYLE